ncbi:MAG TPA: DUF4105 domain-containing protein [Dysgonamonadaceae bacterium]|nr:DUF4105 domain-containing protein [Dysgonamonadaceae bacterium]
MKKLISTALLLSIISVISSFAQVQLSDSAKISLYTVSPWDGEVYALYGHTVVRIEDDSTGVDACFNYGYFDPTQPHFMYSFLRGKTDYVLGVTSYQHFLSENQMKGLEVVRQDINLSLSQKQQLWSDLYVNSLPENSRYRYNYFYDNCATRPRDMIEAVVNGTVVYPITNKNQTFRDLVHECVHQYAWMEFGIDLLIGSDADMDITDKEKMFLPHYLMVAFKDAKVQQSDTISYSLVDSTEIILESDSQNSEYSELDMFKPAPVAFALLLVTFLISFLQLRFNQDTTARIYDTVLFSIAGIAGLIITFLVFFSEHPATSPNWNLAWLHVVHLVVPILIWVKSLKKVVYYYHFINFAVLSLFLLSWWFLPQQLHWATIPFAMSIWLRSGFNFIIIRNNYLKNRQYKTVSYMLAGWRG